MSPLHKKTDLTRWNRSGLQRFRYIDGNAVSYLEALRLAMVEGFTAADGHNRWSGLDNNLALGAEESTRERQTRWLEQYHDARGDYGWEILRTYARASHVLTEHLDAYANESYIGTATQWDSMRRLVEMLGYHPAPPASAETTMALLAKTGKQGSLEKGFAVKNKPEDGSPAVVFETLEDLELDAALNRLYPKDWDRSQQVFTYAAGSNSASFPLSEPLEGITVGAYGVLLIEQAGGTPLGLAVRVIAVSDTSLELQGENPPAAFPATLYQHQVRLLLKPAFKQAPQLTGANVVLLEPDHGLSPDAVIAWKEGSSWYAARVEQVEGRRVRLSRSAPPANQSLYLAVASDAQELQIGSSTVMRVILPAHNANAREYGALWDASLNRIYSHSHKTESGAYLYDYLSGDTYARAYYVPSADPIGVVQASNPQALCLTGRPDKLKHDDWVIADCASGPQAARISTIEEQEKSFELALSRTLSGIELLFGGFSLEIRPRDYRVNLEPIFETDPQLRSERHSHIPLDGDTLPETLVLGRKLILAGKQQAMLVTVKGVDPAARRIKVEPAIPGSEPGACGTSDNYTRHHTRLYGNVARAGHGQSQNEKVLGSGDATQTHPSFDFEASEVSFITDTAFPQGVRAAVTVTVDKRRWKQVATLNDSGPEDHHYVVRMNEDGSLNIGFGNGLHGRRLPSGNNNVRIRHRVGTGLGGNLAPFSLNKAFKPHHLIEEVLQPLPASGGNAMEDVAAMRAHASASVLTLERAVSLADFTHLATGNSGVWQARAMRLQPGMARADKIEVVVVPAGGGELGALKQNLENYLLQHALPGVSIQISPFKSVLLDLAITVRVNPEAFTPEFVLEDLRQALLEAFSLQRARLGEALFYSQVIEVIERVSGVENSECRINPEGFRDAQGQEVLPRQVISAADGRIKRISLQERQIIYLDETLSRLTLTAQAFTP